MSLRFCEISDKQAIEEFLMKDPALNIYLIGDLDPFFFPQTRWYAAIDNETVCGIAMLYTSPVASTLITSANAGPEMLSEMIDYFTDELPGKFYAHFSCGVMDTLRRFRAGKNLGLHYRMVLKDADKLRNNYIGEVKRLSADDLALIKTFYTNNYPENYFDKRMLQTGKYFGTFNGNELTGVAGIHVYSPDKKVAALGNIAVSENYRGKGLCAILTSALCRDLLNEVDIIGLNVHGKNIPAIKCYENCGFEIAGKYEEYEICNLGK